MACSSRGKTEEWKTVNIPKIAFRSFIHIAGGDLFNGSLSQTFCYLLGQPPKNSEHQIWIEAIVIPKHICSIDSVEDVGIESNDSIFNFMREREHKKSHYSIAKEPSDTESETENPED